MSAAKCVCMGAGSAPPLSMGMASRQFNQPPCPCLKCKTRAREQQEARVQAVARSKLGICGKMPPKTSAPEDEPCACAGRRMGPNMGPAPGMLAAKGPGRGPARGLGMGPGTGPGISPGGGGCRGIGGPGMDPSAAACNKGMAPGSSPGRSPVMGQGIGPGRSPGMAGEIGPGRSARIQPESAPSAQGCHPLKPSSNQKQSQDAKCECQGARLTDDTVEAKTVGGLVFGGQITVRKSSVTSRGYHQTTLPDGGCARTYDDYDDDEDEDEDEDQRNVARDLGRDTFGWPIMLQGNKGILNDSGQCRDNAACHEFCGMDTGCSATCHTRSIGAAAAVAGGGGARASGIRVCSNEYINQILTFLMEVLGILVFFAVCTITFWITLGYYIVQLLVDLKNADRNVHVAVGTVLSLLILAFAITLVTHSDGQCRHRAVASCGYSVSSKLCNKCHKKTCDKHKYKIKSMTPSSSSSCVEAKEKAASCPLAKLQLAGKAKRKSRCQAKPKPIGVSKAKVSRSYSDCQGRAIFERSRRNAILIEMKQPPTWLVWLRNSAQEYLHGQ